MKKHENAIKMLMKNAVNCSYYGYYESENGARYLTNGHLIIKLFNTYSTVTTDFVGDLPRLNDTIFLNKLVDFVEAHKNGDYKIQLHMPNIKMWDKYNDTNNCYKLEYDKNKYIGFNADYMKRLYTLTGDNCITIIDSKSPIYMSGVGIECVLLPVALDKNYNSDNYAVFLEELKACYIQDEETKKEKAAKKAAKSTKIIEKETLYKGFTFWIAGKQIFIISDKKKINDNVTKEFLNAITDVTGINCDNISDNDYKYIKSGINAATLLKTVSYYGNEEIYRIETKYNAENFYKNEYDRLIIYNGNMEKIDICADDMSTETKEETTATIQETTATDTDKANNDNVTDTKNTRKKLLYGFYGVFGKKSVFVVTNYENKCKPVLHAFIDAGNGCHELKERAKNHQPTLDDFKKRIAPATIEEICTLKENHIRITTNNGNTIINQSLNDFKTIMLDCYSANEGITPTQETSLKFFKGISDINNRTTTQDTANNAITSETMQADARQDARQTETTQDTTPKHTATKTKKAVSLFIVKDKPAPVKLSGYELPTLKQLDRIPMYVERFKTDFKPLKNNKGYNTRVSNKKVLKKAYNDFIGTVSCYSDKCAIGGGVAVNSS